MTFEGRVIAHETGRAILDRLEGESVFREDRKKQCGRNWMLAHAYSP